MTKLRVGVYRTVFPLYSETFIAEQIRSLSTFRPVVIARDLIHSFESFPAVTIGRGSRFIKKLGFTGFGLTFGFDNHKLLFDLQLIHAHFAPDAALALPIAEMLNIPLVVTCHGSDVTISDIHIAKSLKLSGYRFLLGRRRLFKKTSLFIAVSDFLREKMLLAGFPEEKVVRHYIGIDTTRFVPRGSNLVALNGSPYILSIARHSDVKGLDLLLRAFAIVVAAHPSLRLVQIGGGELTEDLKALTRALGIEKSVDFLGPMPSDKVLPFIQDSKALVLSSRRSATGAEEAFGLVLLEASSCGVPCIGTRVGGIPEAVLDGKTGFLVQPENIDALAEKIALLIANPDLALSMGKRGREMACDSFDLQKQTRQLEVMYSQLIKDAETGKRGSI